MAEKRLLDDAAYLARKNFYFESPEEGLPAEDENARIELRDQLAERIAYMIDHDFELLMQILYRIDVREKDVKMALGYALVNEPAVFLADKIIDRLIEKAETRRKYSQRG